MYNVCMVRFGLVVDSVKDIWKNLKRLLQLAWEADRFVTFGYYGTGFVSAFFPIIINYIFKLFLDELIANQNITATIPVILIALLASRYVIGFVGDFVTFGASRVYFDYLFRYRLQNELNRKFYAKVSNLDVAHFEDSDTQNLITKAQDTFTWRPPDFLRQFQSFFSGFVTYISSFIVLLPFGWWIPFLVTAVVIPILYLRAKFGRIEWSIYGSGAPQVKELWYLRWLLSNKIPIKELKIFQSTGELLNKFTGIQEYLYNLNKGPVVDFVKVIFYPDILKAIVLFAIAYIKLPEVLSGEISIGDFTFFINILDRLVGTAGSMVIYFGEMYGNNLYVNHFFEVMGLPDLIKEPADPKTVKEPADPPLIEFKNVSFKYPGDEKLVLKDVTFTLDPKENVAIVGANGAGKTTIIKLMLRFYDVTKGEILVDGINIKEMSLKQWYSRVGILFQEFVRYDFTVKENIMLGNPQLKDEKRMIKAAKAAGAHEFIKDLPEEYDQLLGRQFEGGTELSIGQWQKLAIARAFYEAAPLLILDEPTSSIDAVAEFEIFKNLQRYYDNKSLLLISHRFSTVRNANKIIVLKNGKIVERGAHDKLVKQGGLYEKMFNKQAQAYLE